MSVVVITLPWPPSVNHYWRHGKGRTYISDEGGTYRRAVHDTWMALGFPGFHDGERLRVEIEAKPPDRRRRDLDNVLKALLDALEHAGAYADDSQIDSLTIYRDKPISHGRVMVAIEVLP